MKLATTLLAPVLLAFLPAGDALSFHPEEGSSVRKTFSFGLDLALDDATMMVNGQDMGGMMMSQIPNVEMASTMVIEDTYNKMGDGRPAELIRSFEEGSMDYEAGEESGSEDMEELVGSKVKFVWNEEDGGYDSSYVEDAEGDEEALNGLGEDMDMRGLLPDGEVSEGDTWDLEGDRIWSVLIPGMDLSRAMANADIPAEAAPVISFMEAEMEKLMENFTFTCEYKGTREEEGVNVGVVGITLSVKHAVDMVPMIEDMLAAQEIPAEVNIEYADMELEISGEGEMLWNQRAGVISNMNLDADYSFFLDASASADMGGQSQDSEVSMEFSGAMNWGVEAE